jgi:diacylglycerol kinase
LSGLLKSFGYAWQGILHGLRSQRNFRIHIVVTVGVVMVGLWLRLMATEWAIIAVTIGLVLQAELFNTALEAIVDKTTPEVHPLAKIAKDCAAGAVFAAVILAVVVGLFIFVPKLI